MGGHGKKFNDWGGVMQIFYDSSKNPTSPLSRKKWTVPKLMRWWGLSLLASSLFGSHARFILGASGERPREDSLAPEINLAWDPNRELARRLVGTARHEHKRDVKASHSSCALAYVTCIHWETCRSAFSQSASNMLMPNNRVLTEHKGVYETATAMGTWTKE